MYEDKNNPERLEYEKAIRAWNGAIVIPEVKKPRYGYKNRQIE